MDLRNLRAFVEVVRHGGFTRAAKVVHLTQSTISKAVKQLEDELGLPLLDRASGHPTLTAAGDIVFRRALAMLAERDSLIEELNALRGLQRGTLRLGLPAIGSSALFAPVFSIYRKNYPGIDVTLVEQGSKRLEELILSGELDLAASLLPVPEPFAWEEVRCEPLDLLVAAGDSLSARQSVVLGDLAARPFILFGEGFALSPIIIDACAAQGFVPTVVARSSQIDFVLELIAGGLGVGFLPRFIAEQRMPPGVCRVPIDDPAMVWNIALVWRRGGYLSQAAQAWIAAVRAQRAGRV